MQNLGERWGVDRRPVLQLYSAAVLIMDTTIQYNTTSSWKAELSLALRSPGAACVAAYVLLCYVLMSTVWAKQYWRPLPGEFLQ